MSAGLVVVWLAALTGLGFFWALVRGFRRDQIAGQVLLSEVWLRQHEVNALNRVLYIHYCFAQAQQLPERPEA